MSFVPVSADVVAALRSASVDVRLAITHEGAGDLHKAIHVNAGAISILHDAHAAAAERGSTAVTNAIEALTTASSRMRASINGTNPLGDAWKGRIGEPTDQLLGSGHQSLQDAITANTVAPTVRQGDRIYVMNQDTGRMIGRSFRL